MDSSIGRGVFVRGIAESLNEGDEIGMILILEFRSIDSNSLILRMIV